jgi:molybdopterin synthase sulfur carrier subunit
LIKFTVVKHRAAFLRSPVCFLPIFVADRLEDPKMTITVLTFGIARQITGGPVTVPLADVPDATTLLHLMKVKYPALAALRSLAVAVNGQYADGTTIIQSGDEVALIPPVSGG